MKAPRRAGSGRMLFERFCNELQSFTDLGKQKPHRGEVLGAVNMEQKVFDTLKSDDAWQGPQGPVPQGQSLPAREQARRDPKRR